MNILLCVLHYSVFRIYSQVYKYIDIDKGIVIGVEIMKKISAQSADFQLYFELYFLYIQIRWMRELYVVPPLLRDEK